MILVVARRELLEVWREGRFRWAGAVVLALMVAALAMGRQQSRRSGDDRAAAAALERQNWLEQGDKDPHSAGHYGMHVFKPLPPLAAFDRGLEPFVGTTVFLEAHRQNQAAFLPAQDATAMRRFGDLTAAAGLQLLVPLLVVLLSFGSLAGERERGTLRQGLGMGARPRDLVLGKALGLGGAVGALLLPVGIFAAVAVGVPAGGDAWVRLALLGVIYALYLAAVLAACLAVSAVAPNARAALVILLAGWAANAVLAPRLATDLVQLALPTPKLAEFEAETRKALQDGLDGHDPRSRRLREFAAKTLRDHGKTRIEDLPFNFHGLVMLESERMAGEVFDHHFGRLWDRLAAQDGAVTWGGVAAPLLALRSVSMALAGTDFAHHRHFSVAAERHRRDVARVLNEDMMRNSRAGDHGYKVGREVWEKLPPFRYEPPPASFALRAAASGVAVLLLWTLGAWAVLLRVARSLRPGA